MRCGCEEVVNRFWIGEENMECRLCEVRVDTLEHAAGECDGMRRWEGEVGVLTGETEEGYWWIKEWLERKNEVEARNLKKND